MLYHMPTDSRKRGRTREWGFFMSKDVNFLPMHFQDLGITTEFSIYQCSSQPWIRYSILAVIYGCFGFLQVCSLYFAFQIRKVKVKGLNDAKYIAVIVYITTIVLVTTLVTSFALSSYINIFASVYSIGIWVTATVILGVMFIPKV